MVWGIEVGIVVYTWSGWIVGNLEVTWYNVLVNIGGLLKESSCMFLIVYELGFANSSSHSELLGMILFVMLFVSVCCILSVRYNSVLAMFVVILMLAKLVFCWWDVVIVLVLVEIVLYVEVSSNNLFLNLVDR